MSLINLFLQKRRMRESHHGIIMVITAYVLSILMLVMGSDVFYNINSEAAGINKTTDEETQEKINKGLSDLQTAELTALLIQSKLQKPFGIVEISQIGLGATGIVETSGGRIAALSAESTLSNQVQDDRTELTMPLHSVSGVITNETIAGLPENTGEKLNGEIVPYTVLAKESPLADDKDKNKKKEEIYSLSTETNNASGITEEEISMLERIVQAEAGGEDMTGKILIANVILNRVEDEHFPDTIEDVIFQNKNGEYQFSPVDDQRYWKVKVSKKSREAVQRALEGEDYSEGALYFIARKRTSSNSAAWFDNHLEWLFKHGGHEFYR